MLFEGCQSKSKDISLEIKTCPNCGAEIEVFSVDTEVPCENCGFVVYNDKLSCAQWCQYAKQCVGEEMHEKMLQVAEHIKAEQAAEKAHASSSVSRSGVHTPDNDGPILLQNDASPQAFHPMGS